MNKMTQTEFELEIRERLGRYKTEHLGVEADGTHKGKAYAHILPKEHEDLNLLETIRIPFGEYRKTNPFIPDDASAYLNSSHVMALNFWFPFCPEAKQLLGWDSARQLGNLIGDSTVEIGKAAFEAELNSDESSQVDWWCMGPNGGQIFCETKYKESFGTASSGKTNYQYQLDNVYREKLEPLVQGDILNDLNYFKKNYQLFRNLWHLHLGKGPDSNRVILLLPERSPSFSKLLEFMETAVPPETLAHKRTTPMSLEKASVFLKNHSDSFEEARHWCLFIYKYCPWALDAAA